MKRFGAYCSFPFFFLSTALAAIALAPILSAPVAIAEPHPPLVAGSIQSGRSLIDSSVGACVSVGCSVSAGTTNVSLPAKPQMQDL